MIIRYANSESETKVNNYINTSITEIITKSNFSNANITDIKYNKNEEVSSVNINTTTVNEIKATINNQIQNYIEKKPNIYIIFPIGNVMNSSLFTGVGPNLKIKIKINSTVITDIRSEFKAAGINQTIHRVVIDIKNSTALILPMFKDNVEFNTSIVLSETVIVGSVPDSYTSVNENADSKIADYIANYAGD